MSDDSVLATGVAEVSPVRRVVDQVATLRVEPSGPLQGQVRLSGAKNSALRCMVASLLTDEPVWLSNFPTQLSDALIQAQMLEALGKRVAFGVDSSSIVEGTAGVSDLAPGGRSIRNTLLVLGALTARYGSASVPVPGGCEIGARPYDLHVGLLEALGATVREEDGLLVATAKQGRLVGGTYESPIRSTGVTENALLCGATLPEGLTLLNPHLTPEVLDLAGMLSMMGATIEVDGSRAVHVRGPERLRGVTWPVVLDRIEAVTFAAAAIASRGEVEILQFPVKDAAVALEYLAAAGGTVFHGNDSVIVRSSGPEPFQLAAGAHPAVHSDMQPLFGALATLASGVSEIVDLRYPERFGYLEELRRLGADVTIGEGRAVVSGGRLRGGEVDALDLRAGAALAVAALGADGPVTIDSAWQILRGYDSFVEKLAELGARITPSSVV